MAKRRLKIMIAAAVAVLLAVVALILFCERSPSAQERENYIQTLTYRQGVQVGGVDVSGLSLEQAKERVQPVEEQYRQHLMIQLRYSDESWDLDPVENLGVTLNTQAQLEEALLAGYEGSLVEQWSVVGEIGSKGKNYPLGYDYKQADVTGALDAFIKQNVDREPVEPSAVVEGDGSNNEFVYTEGQVGLAVDSAAADADVQAILQADADARTVTMDAYTTVTQPSRTIDDVKAATKRIARTETVIPSTSSKNRIYNIKKMASIINGQCIQPGEEWSMNDTAGPRTEAKGWKLAPGVENGTFTDQAGGGICQVSTTLYNSLLKADLEITERVHHTIPSTYIDKGLDSTISTEWPDLKFVNTQDTPVYIFAVATNTSCIVSVYGQPLEEGLTIKLRSEVLQTIPAPEMTVKEDSSKPAGYEDVSVSARDGYYVAAYKQYWRDGEMEKEELLHKDYYKPIGAVVVKGTG